MKSKQKLIGLICMAIGLILVLHVNKDYHKVASITKQSYSHFNRHSALFPLQPIKTGKKIAAITIPSRKERIPVYEGTSTDILQKGAGHYLKSALPGEKNNMILSGHRDTFFRFLKEMKRNDSIIVETANKDYEYKITRLAVVSKHDQTILTPKSRPVLTLTTCYPFTFIGNAPKRYIVTAELIKTIDLEQD